MTRSIMFSVLVGLAVACTGPRGHTGPQGPTGMTGAQGPAGMTGSQGQRGITGSQGPSSVAEAPAQSGSSAGWASLRDILFDFDKADVRPSEMSKIAEIAAYVNQNPGIRVGIDGSTDLLRGANQYNVALSQRRIANVRDALVRAGVSASRIETGGFAVERVKCSEATERCAQRDGRVEVLAHSTDS